MFENQCLLECPIGTFENNTLCSPCNVECVNCSGSSDFCHKGNVDYHFYNNKCYSNCSDLNNMTTNEYYGKNLEDKACQK